LTVSWACRTLMGRTEANSSPATGAANRANILH
jgi:hypothetical protein